MEWLQFIREAGGIVNKSGFVLQTGAVHVKEEPSVNGSGSVCFPEW